MNVQLAAEDVRSRQCHRKVVLVVALALMVLHHDFWWWDNQEVVLSFLPVTLAYHMGFSVAAALLWVYAVFYAWPAELEAWADDSVEGVTIDSAGSPPEAGSDTPAAATAPTPAGQSGGDA